MRHSRASEVDPQVNRSSPLITNRPSIIDDFYINVKIEQTLKFQRGTAAPDRTEDDLLRITYFILSTPDPLCHVHACAVAFHNNPTMHSCPEPKENYISDSSGIVRNCDFFHLFQDLGYKTLNNGDNVCIRVCIRSK